MFKELVPEHIKEHYDTKMEDEDLYKLGAELQSFNSRKGMEIRTSIQPILLCFLLRT